ncbi:hypothetical protein BDW02DRAFT_600743 [Decorospora gaudefroyi]|uniref:Uncharacterized protein n=1 Tax=Decorospora gaudefroyi TaxID=184978 RepID=A0A6A5K933_9PLEO|nr:hypothetical protein BDW02DRAFT_600743 [Decorospora gaudefroyi]
MDTGILSIIMNLLPWQFSGLDILATTMFIFNFLLFTIFTLLSLFRLAKHTRYIHTQTLTAEEELSFLGAPAIAYLTLVAQVVLTCSPAWGYDFSILAYVLWWIGLVWTVPLCSFQVIILAKRNITLDRTLSPAILLPLISVMTLGTTGGLVANYSVALSARMAVPVIVVGYLCIGYALFLSLLYYSYLMHKLLAVGLPPPAKIPSLVITVGPVGQFATAIQVLSTAADSRGMFAAYDRGVWLQAGAASSVFAAATLIALLALGFGFLWISVSWYVVVEALVNRQLPFSLAWWSLIFPMGVFTTALLNLSISLDSSAFRGLTAALLVFMLIIYFVNWAGTVYRLYTKQALGVPQQRHDEDEQARRKKDRYDSGDVAMQNLDNRSYPSTTVTSPEEIGNAKHGAYTYLNTPVSTFDEEEGSHHPKHHHHHVKRFDHHEARRRLFKTGLVKLLITLFFSAAMCVTLKSWEGFRRPIVLNKTDVRIFNSLTIGLSLCLGLNILASLKHYASVFRWSFLTRYYVSLEVFDLILHLSSLAKITKLMVISLPGIRRRTWLRRFRWFKDVRDDGTKWMWLACLLWLAINIGSQILVALLSLFWPMSNSDFPLLDYGNVTLADLNVWYVDTNPPDIETNPHRLINETSLEAAWVFGMEAIAYPQFDVADIQDDLSGLAGTPLYKAAGEYVYRFFNRNPKHQFTNYLASSRNVSATATCTALEVRGDGIVVDEGQAYEDFGNMFLEARPPGTQEWVKYDITEQAAGSVTWMASVQSFCGPRCTNFTVMQYGFSDRVANTSLFLCNSTLSTVTRAHAKNDITTHTDEDRAAVYGTDGFARIAAGAIGWTGIPWNSWMDRQTRSYSQGSQWSPAHQVTKEEVADMLMRFTIGAVAAFDDHGIRYNIGRQTVVPSQGQQLDVDWSYIFSILGGICGIQFFALCLLVLFANRTIVRDDSYFSMAMLLMPVVDRIGAAGGTNMSGDEIKDDAKLRWKKIRYDYWEGKDGQPNKVGIFFEGKDQRESRRSWAAGSYS